MINAASTRLRRALQRPIVFAASRTGKHLDEAEPNVPATPRPKMTDDPTSDPLLRALLDRAGVRAVHVRLDEQWRNMLDHAALDYAAPVRDLLGEACVATLLISAQIKFDGRLTLQLNAEAPLRTLFAECTRQGSFRGIARLSSPGTPLTAPLDLREQGRSSLMAVTIEGIPGNLASGGRYQGLVPLESPDLSHALETYFERSEQLPTRMLLAADGERAAGLLIQQLPAPEREVDDDGWPRAQALFDTLGRDELLASDGEELLFRLFHEESPRLMERAGLRFACTCSRERVTDTLRSLGESEAMAAIGTDGHVEVDCQFCGRRYRFDSIEIAQLFHGGLADAGSEGASDTRH